MFKLSNAIISVLFLAVLVVALIFSIRDYGARTTRDITANLTLRLQEFTLYAAENFQRQFGERLRDLEDLARFLADEDFLVSPESARHFGQLLLEPGIRNFGILGPDGKGFSALGHELDMSADPAFQHALRGDTGIAADMSSTFDQRRVLVIAAPVRRGDKIKAVLVAGINTDALRSSIETRAFDGRTYNLVFDSRGHVLFGILPPGRDLDTLVRDFRQKRAQSSQSAAQMWDFFKTMRESGNAVLRFQGADYAFYMSRVDLARNGWQLVSILPQGVLDEYIVRQNAVTRTLMLRVSAIIVLLLLFVVYTQRRSHRNIRRQQEEYSAIIANISGGVQKISGVNGFFLFLSQNYLDLLGYSREEFERIYENSFANTIYEEDRDAVLLTMSRQLEQNKAIDVEYRTRAKNGDLIWLYNKGTLTYDECRQPYIASIVFDITQNKSMQQAQRISDERYHFILEQHDIIIFEQDLLSGDFYCSTRWMQLFGSAFNILEPDPDGSQIPVHPDDREALRDFQDALQQSRRAAELRLLDVDGLYRWYRVEASNIMDGSGWPIYVIGIITDIDNQKNLELNLRNQAARDSATGMYNKLATEQAIARFLDRHGLDGPGGYAMFMIDFDNFKNINDRLGHAVGDQAICAMARIIRHNFRPADIAGRIGGDEFLVFCTERLSMQQIRERAAKLGGDLHTEWGEGENRCILTASMGVACAPDDGRCFPELYQHADEATYQAKRMGKNGCVFYAEMREAGALPPPDGASVVNAAIDAPAAENDAESAGS
ncbi:diguanylate cyclase [Desulfovibrio sp. PG-178-WT-4]|uniref:Diguanylate cyclase n=1 Tax=Desulfovibrio porci TaxID=2605782 RepID=A0A6L5XMP8_9BACT|nr:diguanylate cyclase [Desulfovibrio porci]MSS28395.1 diguanylate cyclase [Desulfovibrio porci]